MSNIRTIKDIKREEDQANLVSDVASTAMSAIGGGWSLASRYWNKMTSDEGRRSAQRQGEALDKFVSEGPQKLENALWSQEQKMIVRDGRLVPRTVAAEKEKKEQQSKDEDAEEELTKEGIEKEVKKDSVVDGRNVQEQEGRARQGDTDAEWTVLRQGIP